MDRRTLLKTVAAVPAVALMPATPALAEPAQAAAPVVPLSVKPYAKYAWEWFVSHDGETYYEGFPTKEDAIKYAQQCDYSLIAECKQQDFNLDIEGWQLIERLNEDNYELIGEGEGIECTAKQARDLGDMVTRAVEAWTIKHSIHLTAWSFADTKNETDVPERPRDAVGPSRGLGAASQPADSGSVKPDGSK